MSRIRKHYYNTRQRLLSSEHNTATDLIHRAMMELGYWSIDEWDTETATVRKSGVVYGFYVSQYSGLTVAISKGIALLARTPTSDDDAPTEWLELEEATTVDLTAYVDVSNPRWVCIEISDDETTTSELIDVWNPTVGSFTPATKVTERGSDPTITVAQGNATATPVLPSGSGAGKIPIAYVYLDASATAVVTGDIVWCRPILRRDPNVEVQGGGIWASGVTSEVAIKPFRGRYLTGLHFAGSVVSALDVTIDLNASGTPNIQSGRTYPPAGDDCFYAYVCEPPYPTGYTSPMARREFRPFGSRIPSQPSDGYVANGVIMFTDIGPDGDYIDAIGRPIAGTYAFKDSTWNGTITEQNMIYLGAVRVEGTSGDCGGQRTIGGKVMMNADQAPTLDDTDSFTSAGTANSGTLVPNNTAPLDGSGNDVLPDALSWHLTVGITVESSTAMTGAVWVKDYSIGAAGPNYLAGVELTSVDFAGTVSWTYRVNLIGVSGTWANGFATGTGATALSVTVAGYDDTYLSRR